MSSFFRSLPSFATDYSGFISLMHGLGGMMIVHDPSGCLGNYTNTDEPRWYHDPQPVFSSGIRELEAVIGDTGVFLEKAVREVNRRKPPFVCILGTPIPALTGCDVKMLAFELESETGVKCFGVETDGFRFYDDGIEKALDLILDSFACKACGEAEDKAVSAHFVNVLGMTPLDYSIYGEKERVIKYIEAEGMTPGAFLGMGDDLEAVRRARNADLNLVMCAAAFKAAKRMKEEDGISYRIGPFVSVATAKKLLNGASYEKLLIVGEQFCANSLRLAVRELNPEAKVTVATFFRFIEEFAEASDRKLHGENDLRDMLCEDFDAVIADPLVAPLCGGGQHFIACAHPAFSSKLHWQETILYD